MARVSRRNAFAAVVLGLLAMMGAPHHARADSAADIDAGADRALGNLFQSQGYARDLANRAAAVLVFPTVIKAGFGIGGEYGEGALRVRGRSVAYYNMVSASFGFQLGAQARSVVIMFMTDSALASFRRAKGWEVGVDGSVAIINVGAAGSIDTTNLRSDTIGFIFGTKGLMYNLSLEGTKISHINR